MKQTLYKKFENLEMARYDSIVMPPRAFTGLYGVSMQDYRQLKKDTFKHYIITSEFALLQKARVYKRWGKWFKCLENILAEDFN